ncbi:MAG: sugar ABC transporter ATP-binding protein [Candidatus Zixiibacteriota bacterium]
MEGIVKAFPGVTAIRNGWLELASGEIHALVGANGAGKSTLIKILTGVERADQGLIRFLGQHVDFASPSAAWQAGISAIYQEFSLVPSLSVRANLVLGRERTRRGLIDAESERRQAAIVLDRLGVDVDLETPVRSLSTAQQQLVEIGRALAYDTRLLVMDEPTASLSPREVERLFVILRELAARDIAVLFVSHRLDEVMRIADRVTIMRDGETIGTWPIAEVTRESLIEQMVGRRLNEEYPARSHRVGGEGLVVRGLSGGRVRDVSFTVRHGEVLGLSGLMGAGRTEVARLIFGADRKSAGEIGLDGQPLRIRSPREAIRRGICLLTEDRKAQGLVLKASARDNFALPNLTSWARWGWIGTKRETSRFRARVAELDLRLTGPDQRAETLSGGNQQKLLVARWLETNSRVIIFDEPTRGIDVGAKHDMYVLIDRLASQGKIIIVISSEFTEVLGVCDRILVMRAGRVAGELEDVTAATEESIMALAV